MRGKAAARGGYQRDIDHRTFPPDHPPHLGEAAYGRVRLAVSVAMVRELVEIRKVRWLPLAVEALEIAAGEIEQTTARGCRVRRPRQPRGRPPRLWYSPVSTRVTASEAPLAIVAVPRPRRERPASVVSRLVPALTIAAGTAAGSSP
jgi:hypothetical protein